MESNADRRKYRFLLGIDLYDGIDSHEKWHQPFSMATTIPRNGIDRFKWQRPFTKGKFASPTSLLDFIRRRVGVGELVRRRVDWLPSWEIQRRTSPG